MSPQIEPLLGYTPADWVGNVLWRERIHPHDRERILQIADEAAVTGASYTEEYRYLAKDGRVVWVIDQVSLLERDDRGKPLLLQGVMLDVTDRREAEAKVAEIENWYRHITDESPAMTWVVSGRVDDPNVRWSNFYVSRSSRRLLGYEPEEMTRPPGWRAFLHPDDNERVAGENQVVWKTGAPWTSEYRMIAKDGRVIWIHLEGRAIDMDENGAPSSYQAVMIDVTAQKDREARLIEEGRAGRALLDGMPAIAWTRLTDKDGRPSRLIYIASQASSWLGYSPEELLADPELDSKMTHPEDAGAVAQRLSESGASGMLQVTNRVICKDGQIRWFQTTARRSPAEVGVPQVWQGVTVALDPDLLPGSPQGWPESQDSGSPGPTAPGSGFLE
jgi:PAS domain S-box-containing protein